MWNSLGPQPIRQKMAKFGCRMFFNLNILCVHIITSDVLWKDNRIAYHMVLILTYSDGKKMSFTYDELDSKQKYRYSYAVMEMQPHIQAAKWHQYEVYRANRFILVILLVLWKKGQRSFSHLSNF